MGTRCSRVAVVLKVVDGLSRFQIKWPSVQAGFLRTLCLRNNYGLVVKSVAFPHKHVQCGDDIGMSQQSSKDVSSFLGP